MRIFPLEPQLLVKAIILCKGAGKTVEMSFVITIAPWKLDLSNFDFRRLAELIPAVFNRLVHTKRIENEFGTLFVHLW